MDASNGDTDMKYVIAATLAFLVASPVLADDCDAGIAMVTHKLEMGTNQAQQIAAVIQRALPIMEARGNEAGQEFFDREAGYLIRSLSRNQTEVLALINNLEAKSCIDSSLANDVRETVRIHDEVLSQFQ
jgi:hypothetical protein